MSDALVQYLREARATETGLIQVLRTHIAATPPGHHRARLEEHLEQRREHERQLAARVDQLGGGGEDPLRQALSLLSGPVGFGLGVARGAARVMLSVVGLPLTLFRDGHDSGADRVLRNIRAEAASAAMELATYTAIERLARAEGDSQTAELAAELRGHEEEMLAYYREAAGELSEVLAEPGARPAPRRKPAPEPIRVREPRGNGSPTRPSPPTPDIRPPAPEPPQTPHPAVEVPVSEEPELVAESADVGAEDETGPEVGIAEPWEGYDRMKAAEILRRLEDASDEVAAVVRLYEAAGKNRQTVIRAAERRLRV